MKKLKIVNEFVKYVTEFYNDKDGDKQNKINNLHPLNTK